MNDLRKMVMPGPMHDRQHSQTVASCVTAKGIKTIGYGANVIMCQSDRIFLAAQQL